MEETLRRRARIAGGTGAGVVLRARSVLALQSRRDKVGVRRGGIRRGEELDVRSGRVGGAAVDEVTVIEQNVHVRH